VARVLALSGAQGHGSRIRSLMSMVVERLNSDGHEVCRLEVTMANAHRTILAFDWIACLRDEVRRADAFTFASPVYHNSYSGLLKMTLDEVDAELFEHKVIGLCSSSGGPRSSQAVDHLLQVVRGLKAVTIPCQLILEDADWVSLGDGRLGLWDPKLQIRIDRFCRELAWYATTLTTSHSRTSLLSSNGS
jgi:NAD(P)H-dependent FMN reductase